MSSPIEAMSDAPRFRANWKLVVVLVGACPVGRLVMFGACGHGSDVGLSHQTRDLARAVEIDNYAGETASVH